MTILLIILMLCICWRQAQRRPPPSSVGTWVRSASTLIKGPALSREHTETMRVHRESEREREREREREKESERERKSEKERKNRALFPRHCGKVSVCSGNQLSSLFCPFIFYLFFPSTSLPSSLQSRRRNDRGIFLVSWRSDLRYLASKSENDSDR